MTTWYSGPDGSRAFSVRPDLWPAGWMVWEKFDHAVGRWPPGYLADTMTMLSQPTTPAPGAGAPGVAEALVLGGRVAVLANNARDMPWTPEDP